MSVTQAANTLGISRVAVHKAIQQKRLAVQRYGNAVLVNREAVLAYKRGRSGSLSAISSAKVSPQVAVMAKAR